MSSTDEQTIDQAEAIEIERELKREIGEILADFRLEAGWTQREAAPHLGTSQQNIPRIERGDSDLKLTTLQKYASAYGYEVEISFVPVDE